MFRRGKPGAPKVLLEVVHGLLSRVDREAVAHEFKGVWPVLDKAQEKDARRVALAFLARLEQQGRLPADAARLSDLTGAKGERVYALLAALCKAALQSQLVRLGRVPPRLADPDVGAALLGPRMARAAAVRVAAQRQRFLRCVARAAAQHAQHQQLAAELLALAAARPAPPPPPSVSASSSSGAAAAPRDDGTAAERVRSLWSALGGAGPGLPGLSGAAGAGAAALGGDPAAAARAYGQLAGRLAAAGTPRLAGGRADERAGRLESLLRLEGRLRARLDSLAARQQQHGSAARLAAAAARVGPAFDKSDKSLASAKSFSPRKKLVL